MVTLSSMAVLSEDYFMLFTISGFRFLCPNLMTMYVKGLYHAITQAIRTIKTFTEYKSATANTFTAKYKKRCHMLCVITETK